MTEQVKHTCNWPLCDLDLSKHDFCHAACIYPEVVDHQSDGEASEAVSEADGPQ